MSLELFCPTCPLGPRKLEKHRLSRSFLYFCNGTFRIIKTFNLTNLTKSVIIGSVRFEFCHLTKKSHYLSRPLYYSKAPSKNSQEIELDAKIRSQNNHLPILEPKSFNFQSVTETKKKQFSKSMMGISFFNQFSKFDRL